MRISFVTSEQHHNEKQSLAALKVSNVKCELAFTILISLKWKTENLESFSDICSKGGLLMRLSDIKDIQDNLDNTEQGQMLCKKKVGGIVCS